MKCGVRVGNLPHSVGGHRIVGIVAGDDVEKLCRVLDRARHRTERVVRGFRRHHPEPADEGHGGSQPDEAMDRRGSADRTSGVFTDSDHAEVRRDAGTASTRRAARISRRIVGVAGDAEGGAYIAGSELAHRRLGEDDGAGRFHLCDDRGVSRGYEVLENDGAVCGRHVARLDLILEKDGDAVQGPDESS